MSGKEKVCHYCGAEATTRDHVIPQAFGGPDTPDNLVDACATCNSSKGSLPAEVFQLTRRERTAWLKAHGWNRLGSNSWRSPDETDRAFYTTAAALRHEGFVRAGITAGPGFSRDAPPEKAEAEAKPRHRMPIERPADPTWTFYDGWGVEITKAELTLYWEVSLDPISDDWLPGEITAEELLHRWWTQYQDYRDKTTYYTHLPKSLAPISWYVDVYGPHRRTFEAAPFYEQHGVKWNENFLTFFSWPINEQTGEPLRWPTLPVVDKLWNAEQANKGGFIQEATGWKPSAYQHTFDPVQIAAAAGITLRMRDST